MNKLFIALAIVVLALILWLALRPTDIPAVQVPAAIPADGVDPLPAPDAMRNRADKTTDDTTADEYTDISLDESAIASLRGARELGYDPRTPPIARSAPREEPSTEELADPEKYAEYEARQERKLKRAYVQAAGPYLEQLKADIEKGKAYGIPPDEIAKVREKVRRIEAMRAQLLAEDPRLLDESSPVPKKPSSTGGLPQMRPEGPLGNAGGPNP